MALDQDGKKPTTVFRPEDIFYLEFDLVDAPARYQDQHEMVHGG